MVGATSDYLKPISFLVVDDRAYMRSVIKNILITLGCKRIDEAHHGAEALSIMRSAAPDIVLTEWMLRPVSGFEMLKAVRSDKGPHLQFTPVIMVTSETRREKVFQARNAGVTEFVAKPFNAKNLILRIREVIERPQPFVQVNQYFGPDRRGKGGPRPPAEKSDSRLGLTQEQIDKLVAGEAIKERE